MRVERRGDQLAVDQQVNVALVGSDAGVVWETILAPARLRRTSRVRRLMVWPLRGARMVSLAVEVGRAARGVRGRGRGRAPGTRAVVQEHDGQGGEG